MLEKDNLPKVANEILRNKPMKEYCDKDRFEMHTLGFIDGFNKAREWHLVKDKLPPSGETVLLYYGVNIMGKAIMSTGCIDCKGTWYKDVDDEPIKWQEITLP